jgi:hypothetical protein
MRNNSCTNRRRRLRAGKDQRIAEEKVSKASAKKKYGGKL